MLETLIHSHLYLEIVLVSFYIVLIVYTIYRILMDTRSSSKAIAYILLVIIMPIIGSIVYFSFGINYSKNKLYSKKVEFEYKFIEDIRQIVQSKSVELRDKYKSQLGQYIELINFHLGDSNALVSENDYKLLINGKEKFPEIFREIELAKKFIHIEYYIWENDTRGNQLKKPFDTESK